MQIKSPSDVLAIAVLTFFGVALSFVNYRILTGKKPTKRYVAPKGPLGRYIPTIALPALLFGIGIFFLAWIPVVVGIHHDRNILYRVVEDAFAIDVYFSGALALMVMLFGFPQRMIPRHYRGGRGYIGDQWRGREKK